MKHAIESRRKPSAELTTASFRLPTAPFIPFIGPRPNQPRMIPRFPNLPPRQLYSAVGMRTYIDWIPTRRGPVNRFHTRLPALANIPVDSFWNCVSICTVESL